jgi:hypothetical protein
MAARDDGAGLGAARVLDADEVQGVLSGAFYAADPVPDPIEERGRRSGRAGDTREKPTHYKVICISLYMKDLERLDGLVDQLKERGLTKANRSALIRAALDQVDLDKVPKGI